MSFTDQEKEKALLLYDELCSIGKVIKKLGYPSRQNMYTWIKNRGIEKRRKKADCRDLAEHRRHPSLELKLDILHRCFENGEDIKSISEETGYSRCSIYMWRKKYLAGGAAMLVDKKKHLSRGKLEINKETENTNDSKELQGRIKDLELENDILKQTIEILKKDQGIDVLKLKNREKAMIIDALKDKYSLSFLLIKLSISKSSYFYQHISLNKPFKYEETKKEIIKLFNDNDSRYGYRRIKALLMKKGIFISEKIVRKIMKDNNLIVKGRKAKKYSSYLGEISEAVSNIVNRNFHSSKPNEKLLTDISEFSIPAGKVYLSPIIDCFDGLVSAYKVGVSPNAQLVNSMLDNYKKTLKNGEKPIIHSDRGCHYRWPGWIDKMNEYGFTRSMSKKGCSPDNSACEGFFGRMKNEMFYGRDFTNVTIEQFIQIIDNYISWYNNTRIKKSLGYKSIVEHRQSLGLA